MSNIILGTAGHIDHGKTTLIKALTGINTDRLFEEKKRGITIDLGFAFLTLPSGRRVGIVDVPGHEKFIKNMVAGVGGIDIVLFIVAADEGVMPQTKEHLNILKILNIQKGLTVLTKKDMVDDEWLKLVIEDVSDEIRGTFLEKASIIPVSSVTGDGIPELIAAIEKMCSEEVLKDVSSPFRLPIDRVFTMPGIGTVVTGSLISGNANVGDAVEIFPIRKKSRIRGLQVHGKTVETVEGGQRTALNLTDVKVDDLSRGDVVTQPGALLPVTKALAYFKLLADVKDPLKNRERVRFHIGTKEVMARLALLDRDKLLPGKGTFVRVIFEETITCAYKDRYVVRSYSPITTIGGGKIIYVNPHRIKKSIREKTLKSLQEAYEGDLKEFILGLLEIFGNYYLKITEIAPYTGKSISQINQVVKTMVDEGLIEVFKLGGEDLFVDKNFYSKITEKALLLVENYHKKHPLSNGIAREELRSRIRIEPLLFDSFLNRWEDDKTLETVGSIVKKKNYTIKLTESQKLIYDKILKCYDEAGWAPPSINQISLKVSLKKEEEVKQMITKLVTDGKLVKINEELYMTKKWVDKAIQLLKSHYNNKQQINPSEFKNILSTTRKYAIPLLEYMDRIKITKRQADGTRVLL